MCEYPKGPNSYNQTDMSLLLASYQSESPEIDRPTVDSEKLVATVRDPFFPKLNVAETRVVGDVNSPSEPPCSRCRREQRDCVFLPSVRQHITSCDLSTDSVFGAARNGVAEHL